jgi:FtsP/CotA-like multicopper oxidase with cupredoxin domain/YHS domain-containing protein
VLDPVCAMTISPDDGVGHIDHKGHTYYFCSRSCLDQFRANPDAFLGQRPASAATWRDLDCGERRHGPEAAPLRSTTLSGTDFDLRIGETPMNFTGSPKVAITVNGSVPAPLLRWREGDTVTLRVANTLGEDASIHWHGILLPANMDGVPGLSFHGIRPGETYVYRFEVRQAGTY